MNSQTLIKRLTCLGLIIAIGCPVVFAQSSGPRKKRTNRPTYVSPATTPATTSAKTPESKVAPEAVSPEAPRMLVAIVPHGKDDWFFKTMSTSALLGAVKKDFVTMLRSIRFENGDPTWTLPKGWRKQAGTGMRFATLVIEHGGKTAEVSVISLSRTPVLPQVNRWRGQLGLKPITEAQLPSGTQTLEANGLKITLTDLTGSGKGQPDPGATSIAGVPSAGHPTVPMQNTPSTPLPSIRSYYDISYKTPEGWIEKPAAGMRVAAFGVGPTELTVIPLSATAGDMTSNVNRWREQIGLEKVSPEQIQKDARPIPVAGKTGHWFHLVGANDNSMLALIAIHGSKAWFVKMIGPAEFIAGQQDHFQQFARSLTFGQ
ncbi:MAG: hypothetical protein ACYTGQ_11330 [Planctomycetota bacterium]|jgi:hypothetical protein